MTLVEESTPKLADRATRAEEGLPHRVSLGEDLVEDARGHGVGRAHGLLQIGHGPRHSLGLGALGRRRAAAPLPRLVAVKHQT